MWPLETIRQDGWEQTGLKDYVSGGDQYLEMREATMARRQMSEVKLGNIG